MTWVDEKIKEEAAKDPQFMKWFEEESKKLDIAVAMDKKPVLKFM